MRTQTMSIREFMAGDYKKEKKKKYSSIARKVGTSIAIPMILAKPTFAATPEAIPATAKEWMGEQTLSTLAHVLDPVVDILVALSFPVASVIIVGACFLFMFSNAEKAWTMIQNAGLGYVLIQVSPLILNVLKQVGNAV
ncbi:hypothetical protein [Cytobacillus oceanisediminis]|uniref:TrbC/VIRB2 family protein n=1 Tax=Cytobacillus oceanisediminis TaxID=665099 RepID=A0ABX3CM25_9BACI|nr:hypothetical protein [Cytobacillus oceanisediminis]OHX43441.1 hypothetical protein BBV17_26395 [Cytobacillus oceanisediminis]